MKKGLSLPGCLRVGKPITGQECAGLQKPTDNPICVEAPPIVDRELFEQAQARFDYNPLREIDSDRAKEAVLRNIKQVEKTLDRLEKKRDRYELQLVQSALTKEQINNPWRIRGKDPQGAEQGR